MESAVRESYSHTILPEDIAPWSAVYWGDNTPIDGNTRLISFSGELKSFTIRMSKLPVGVKSIRFRLYINRKRTPVQLNLARHMLSAKDKTHSVSVKAWDKLRWRKLYRFL